VEYQKIATGRLGSVRSENEAFSMSEAIKIIETIFNNRLRKIAVKEHHSYAGQTRILSFLMSSA
jgi:hypothetical protein